MYVVQSIPHKSPTWKTGTTKCTKRPPPTTYSLIISSTKVRNSAWNPVCYRGELRKHENVFLLNYQTRFGLTMTCVSPTILNIFWSDHENANLHLFFVKVGGFAI